MTNSNTDLSPLRRVNRGNRCPICDHAGWCSVRADGSAVICMRMADGATGETKDGGWLHVLRNESPGESLPPRPSLTAVKAEPLTAPILRRHAIYTALLESLRLDERHADDLRRRGLHDTHTAYELYASVPTDDVAQKLCVELAAQHDLASVPGFFRQGKAWRLNVGEWQRGYFIPVRDLAGRIQALTIRRDAGDPRYLWLSSRGKPDGATSGVPLHFAGRHLFDKGECVITEGALKAEVIAQFMEVAVIGLASVTAHAANIGNALRAAGVRRARIAFDADWRINQAVSAQLQRLGDSLQEAGLTVSLLDWSATEGKGLDDVLVKEAA